MDSDKKSGVYIIKNIVNGKSYIGSTVNLTSRRKRHFNQLRRGNHDNKHLQNSFNLNGEENFKFEILLYCSVDSLIQEEQKLIDEIKPEYNIRKIAKSNLGLKHTDEAKEKIRETHKGNDWGFKKGHKPKNIKKGKDNYFFGIRLFGDKNPFYGKTHSDLTKNKISMANKKSRNKGENNPNSKLTDYDVLEIREKYKTKVTVLELSKTYNVSESHIRKIIKGTRR